MVVLEGLVVGEVGGTVVGGTDVGDVGGGVGGGTVPSPIAVVIVPSSM